MIIINHTIIACEHVNETKTRRNVYPSIWPEEVQVREIQWRKMNKGGEVGGNGRWPAFEGSLPCDDAHNWLKVKRNWKV